MLHALSLSGWTPDVRFLNAQTSFDSKEGGRLSPRVAPGARLLNVQASFDSRRGGRSMADYRVRISQP